MSKSVAICAAADCAIEVSKSKPFCARHWTALPGKLRSRLSMSATGKANAVLTSDIGRAVRLIGMIK